MYKRKLMKIVIVNNLPSYTGVGRYSFSLFFNLKTIYNNITLINLYETNLANKLINIIEKNQYHMNLFQKTTHSLVQLLRFLRQGISFSKLYSYEFSLYHITNPWIALYFLPRLYQIHFVITIHDIWPFLLSTPSKLELFLKKPFKEVLMNSGMTICVTKHTKKDLLRFVNIDPEKIRVIYYGVDHELFKPRDKLEARRRLGLPLDRPIILNVGSEEPRKNIPILLKSFKKLLNGVPNALLARVGEKTAYIEKLIKSLGLNGKVLYRRASPNEVALYYNAADLLCFPSYYEGFGNPPLEAMASGLPVIAGNRTSIPEVVSDAGILLDPFDVEGFAYWMREVLMNEDLRNKLSEAGYKRSMSFSWEKCARETLEVYREVLNEA
jgi:glycosyltransferase involved in cell wall biosynthesis